MGSTEDLLSIVLIGGALYFVLKTNVLGKLKTPKNNNGTGTETPAENNNNSNEKPAPATGGTATGSQWFKANGATTTLPAGRQDGQSNRWNKNVASWQNGFEVMGYVDVTGMQAASHIGLKMGGPNHSGNCSHKEGGACCCWWDGGLRRNGASYLEIEKPHPHNLKTKLMASMGRNIDAGMLGVRWFNAKEGNARRVMFWVDISGKANTHQWKLLYNILDTGQFMPTTYYSQVPSDMELEIRISDVPANKIKWATGPIARKLEVSSSSFVKSNYARSIIYDRISVA